MIGEERLDSADKFRFALFKKNSVRETERIWSDANKFLRVSCWLFVHFVTPGRIRILFCPDIRLFFFFLVYLSVKSNNASLTKVGFGHCARLASQLCCTGDTCQCGSLGGQFITAQKCLFADCLTLMPQAAVCFMAQ